MRRIKAVISLCLVISILSVISCAWDRRKPVEIIGYNQEPPHIRSKFVVFFHQVIPDKPLNEAVWDNVVGPIWDHKESKQIGFTQHYKAQFFAIPPALLPAAAQSGVHLIDTRIVIPFGNIFTSVFESALIKSNVEHYVCFDSACLSRFEGNTLDILLIHIDKFFVWEYPLNHLNFYLTGYSSYGNKFGLINTYPFEVELLKYELGSVLSTHAHFIKKMNLVSNQFAEYIVDRILRNIAISVERTT